MRISVVLATYNGEKYIRGQLESIFAQTRCPDEIIVMDDCSTDNTVNIVRELFNNSGKEISSKIIINETNQGWRKNFLNGFHQTSGDIIFCADQDDVWYENKLEIMAKILEENASINVLACNLTPLYETGATKLAPFYINNYGKNYLERPDLQKEGLTVLRPGCTICFRKEILPWIYSVWVDRLAHDEVIWAVGIVSKSLFIVNESLIHFRRHASNNSPSNEKKTKPRLSRLECDYIKISNILKNKDQLKITKDSIDYLECLKVFSGKRTRAMNSHSLIQGLRLLRSLQYYGNPKSWIGDMIAILRK